MSGQAWAMDGSDYWVIVYDGSFTLATQHKYFTERQALDAIEEWKRRNERGGRPDITREKLDRMRVMRYDQWNHLELY